MDGIVAKHSSLLVGKSHLPINDFYLLENPNKYSLEEKQLRIKLTAVYRLIEINGWSMGIYNHVTAKLGDDKLLIHPFGMHYNELTASSMLKIEANTGRIADQGSTNFELNWPGYIIHSAIHLARKELKCIIHLHYAPVTAASAFKYGLLPICQEQAQLGEIKYLDYSGILTEEDERDAVAAEFGDKCKVMILRNHGLIVAGESVEEAFYYLCNLMRACESQARLLTAGSIDNLVFMNSSAAQQAYQMVQSARYPIRVQVEDTTTTRSIVSSSSSSSSSSCSPSIVDDDTIDGETDLKYSYNLASDGGSTTSGNESDLELTSLDDDNRQIEEATSARKSVSSNSLRKTRIVGYVTMFELDFEAQMRNLDLAGHQTGYIYKRPLVRYYRH